MTRSRAAPPAPLTPDPRGLARYAAGVGHHDEGDVLGGIQAQQTSGMTWERVQLNVVLMLNHRGTPSDLRAAARTHRTTPTATTT